MFDELSRRSILWAGVLAGLLVLGYAIIARLRRGLRGPESAGRGLMGELQAAYEAGELDEEEYRRVRESLDRRAGDAGPPARAAPRPIPPRPGPPASGDAGPSRPPGAEGNA